MRIAISYQQDRVSPVFDVAARILLVDIDKGPVSAIRSIASTDVNFVQAVAQVVGMAMEMCRANKGLRESIDILEMMQDPKTLKDKRRTPYEGVPTSFTAEEMTRGTV